jgi:hypothetical protein
MNVRFSLSRFSRNSQLLNNFFVKHVYTNFHENPSKRRQTDIEKPTRCNNNDLLISKISSTCFGQTFAHLQERKTEIFTACGIVSWYCSRLGSGEWQRGTISLLQYQDTIPHVANLSLTLLKMGKNLPETC